MRFRKKPVEIEAVQYVGLWTVGKDDIPDWLWEAFEKPLHEVGCIRRHANGEDLQIFTLEGIMTASKGDWIIRGVKNEIYSCKPDIFADTYEELPAGQPGAPAGGEQ
jgi:hypothetical protein